MSACMDGALGWGEALRRGLVLMTTASCVWVLGFGMLRMDILGVLDG